jgi:hypothetical protein
MKAIIILNAIVLSSFNVYAQSIDTQESYNSMKNIFREQLKEHVRDTSYFYAEKFLTHFDIALKADTAIIRDFYYGIGIVIPEDGNQIYLLPAYHSVYEDDWYKDKLRGFLTVYAGDDYFPTEATTEYVNLFLNNEMDNFRSTSFYKSIRGTYRPHSKGLKETELDFVFNNTQSFTFYRQKDGWLLAVSIDAEYQSFDKSQMIFYAFRLNPTDIDIFKN